ncbi:jg2154 [Pararge aegeria aegeria]|uniref:Jg2154 protein n=1 Tax=Pararge aegeria aegeria TaxID=348720 RepID=A0A8S4QRJ8_9NEOP|nr:jg2154 [Pararge aegeria aegeria]
MRQVDGRGHIVWIGMCPSRALRSVALVMSDAVPLTIRMNNDKWTKIVTEWVPRTTGKEKEDDQGGAGRTYLCRSMAPMERKAWREQG